MDFLKHYGICFMLIMGLASASGVSLTGEEIYCTRYGISFWCDEGGAEFLEGLPLDILAEARYINDYAFSDDVRYSGDIRITSITVTADLTRTSGVEASYILQNPSSERQSVHITALESPKYTKVYVDGTPLSVDPLLDGFDLNFAAGEQKGVRLIFREPLYGDIFAYNVNLLFDGKTSDNHITRTGTFKFLLPETASSFACSPSGYTTSVEDGRTKISWQKSDFVPWTNPFNDLICKWDIGPTSAAIAAESQEAEAAGDLMPVLAVLILVLALVAVTYKKGMLDGVLRK